MNQVRALLAILIFSITFGGCTSAMKKASTVNIEGLVEINQKTAKPEYLGEGSPYGFLLRFTKDEEGNWKYNEVKVDGSIIQGNDWDGVIGFYFSRKSASSIYYRPDSHLSSNPALGECKEWDKKFPWSICNNNTFVSTDYMSVNHKSIQMTYFDSSQAKEAIIASGAEGYIREKFESIQKCRSDFEQNEQMIENASFVPDVINGTGFDFESSDLFKLEKKEIQYTCPFDSANTSVEFKINSSHKAEYLVLENDNASIKMDKINVNGETNVPINIEFVKLPLNIGNIDMVIQNKSISLKILGINIFNNGSIKVRYDLENISDKYINISRLTFGLSSKLSTENMELAIPPKSSIKNQYIYLYGFYDVLNTLSRGKYNDKTIDNKVLNVSGGIEYRLGNENESLFETLPLPYQKIVKTSLLNY